MQFAVEVKADSENDLHLRNAKVLERQINEEDDTVVLILEADHDLRDTLTEQPGVIAVEPL